MQSRSSSSRTSVLLGAAVISLVAANRSVAAPLYTFTDLGYVSPQGIDSAGDVMLTPGNGFAGGVFHSYGPQAGQVTPPSAYGGGTSGGAGTGSQPSLVKLTNSGAVLGMMPVAGGWSPFIWTQGKETTLTPPAGYSGAGPTDVNSAGAVVGTFFNIPGGVNHAFLYQNGQMIELGSLGGSSYGSAINSAGQVAGYASPSPTSAPHAFLYQHGKMTDLGTLGGHESLAYAINDRGQVVGNFTLDPNNIIQHAFLYSAGKMVDLGALPGSSGSEAIGINNSGTIVGDSGGRLVIWQNGSILDVNNLLKNPPGFLLSSATGINDLGQIVGISFGPGGGYGHGFLLTPTDLPAPAAFTPVAYPASAPEPGAFVVFAVMGLACIARHRIGRAAQRPGAIS